MTEEEVPAVILDIGSGTTKCCVAGDDRPRAVFPSVINGKRVLNRGLIASKDGLEALLQKAFGSDGLKVASEERPLLCTECPLNPKYARESLTQLAFEKFNVPAFYLSIAGVLALYASGRTTGLVAEMGYGLTSTIPVFEGYALPHAILQFDIGMCDTILHLKKFMETVKGINFSKNDKENEDEEEEATIDLIANIINKRGITPPNNQSFESQKLGLREKNKLINCLPDLAQKEECLLTRLPAELVEEIGRYTLTSPPTMTEFKLPDGQIIHLGEELILAGQLPFQPSLYDLANQEQTAGLRNLRPVSEQIFHSISKIDVTCKIDMYRNIVLAGGNSLYHGIEERLRWELVGRTPLGIPVKVDAPAERAVSALVGGSILTSLSTFSAMWITKAEYDESGPSLVHRKCF
jgi:actin